MKMLTFRNNDQMPVICLGKWKSEPGNVYEAVKDAVYGNENEIGQALSELIEISEQL